VSWQGARAGTAGALGSRHLMFGKTSAPAVPARPGLPENKQAIHILISFYIDSYQYITYD